MSFLAASRKNISKCALLISGIVTLSAVLSPLAFAKGLADLAEIGATTPLSAQTAPQQSGVAREAQLEHPDLLEEGIIDEAAVAAAMESLKEFNLTEEGELLTDEMIFNEGKTPENVIRVAKRQLGKKYSTGATGPTAFDCSGFVNYVYKGFGVDLERASRSMSEDSAYPKIENREDLQVGDLVFFSSPNSGSAVGHVGIYMGDSQFIHCTNSVRNYGVTISNMESDYYNGRFKGARRVL